MSPEDIDVDPYSQESENAFLDAQDRFENEGSRQLREEN